MNCYGIILFCPNVILWVILTCITDCFQVPELSLFLSTVMTLMMRIHPALPPLLRVRPVTPPFPPAIAVSKEHTSVSHTYRIHSLGLYFQMSSRKMMRVQAPKTWLQRPPVVKRSRSSLWRAPLAPRGCWVMAPEAEATQRARWTAGPCAAPPGARSPGRAWRTCSASTRRPTRAQCGWAQRTDGMRHRHTHP